MLSIKLFYVSFMYPFCDSVDKSNSSNDFTASIGMATPLCLEFLTRFSDNQLASG